MKLFFFVLCDGKCLYRARLQNCGTLGVLLVDVADLSTSPVLHLSFTQSAAQLFTFLVPGAARAGIVTASAVRSMDVWTDYGRNSNFTRKNPTYAAVSRS